MTKPNIISFLLILLVAIILSKPMLVKGLFTMHDDQQVARLFLMDKALKNGQFPVRWVDELGFGFGYPLFNFYPPFTYYFGEIFHLSGFGFINSVKIIFFLSLFLSGLAMYFFTKSVFGKTAAFVAALFYMASPYRALDVYVRGAFAESFSFVYLPLILYFFYWIAKRKNFYDAILAGFFLALLMITHNLIFLASMVVLPVYAFFQLIGAKDKKYYIGSSLLALITAFALSAFFWLPSLAEKNATLVNKLLLTDLASYKIHFVYLAQLWNWTWGFGGSAAGLADGISFKIGKVNVIASFLAFIIAIHFLTKKYKPQNQILTIGLFLSFALSAFMTLNFSSFIWDHLPPLWYLQFPWRFLTFCTLFSSALIAAFIQKIQIRIGQVAIGILLATLLIFTNLKLFKPQNQRPELTDQTATAYQTISWDVSKTSFEYMTRDFPLVRGPLGTNVADLNQNNIPTSKLDVAGKNITIENNLEKPQEIKFIANSRLPSTIRANIYYFPGWQVEIDGNKQAFSTDNMYRLITFGIGAGTHNVDIKFINTPPRNIGNFVSLLTFAIILFTFFKKWIIRIKN